MVNKRDANSEVQLRDMFYSKENPISLLSERFRSGHYHTHKDKGGWKSLNLWVNHHIPLL